MSAWVDAIRAAGAVPASYRPEASAGRGDLEVVAGAEAVEDPELRVHALTGGEGTAGPTALSFLDGIQQWRVVAYEGVTPIVRAWVAAAVRRRGGDRRLRTVLERVREVAITRVAALSGPVQQALERSGVEILDLAEEDTTQPGRALEAARRAVENARVALEKALGERCAAALEPNGWLVLDGVLSESAQLAAHPRVLGVIKSHGAQYFTGAELERALTISAAHRTSVFRPRGRARHEVHSWYLRLWPWEGNDLLYGLLRVEARPHPDTVAAASTTSTWLYAERAPLATPDARWDRLMYPIHDVETYLRARAPRDLLSTSGARLPQTAS